MKKIVAIVLLMLGVLCVILYVGDYVFLRVKIARNSGYGTVEVRQYYAIPRRIIALNTFSDRLSTSPV